MAHLLLVGISWKWLYVIAGTICVLLIVTASIVKYPRTIKTRTESTSLSRTFRLAKNPFALGFSLACFLYVAVECAIYVWLPTYLKDNRPSSLFMATYVVSIFFILRAGGRFLGAWVLERWAWTRVLAVFTGAILLCFLGAMFGGPNAAVYLLALSGIFMSVIYPTLNSKGISCFPKSEHGAVSGIILFFTCGGAALGPLAMGVVSDVFGGLKAGFALATVFSALLFIGMLYNLVADPTLEVLHQSDATEYGIVEKKPLRV